MKALLVDTGPLVALIDRRDRYHVWARDFFDAVEPPLSTCEPVFTEACFLLRSVGGQDAVMELVAIGAISIEFRGPNEIQALQALMRKYGDIPMSLADACLVRMTELQTASTVVTFDSDFRIYRRNQRQVVPTITPD